MATQVFLLTDIEGSTGRWVGRPAEMRTALERHDELLSTAITAFGGRVFKHTGDGMLATFASASAAVAAAVAAQQALGGEDWGAIGALTVRMAVHAGEAEARGDDWFGPALNRGVRLMGIAHGGQILASDAARGLTVDGLAAGVTLADLGSHRLRDLPQPERVWQVIATGIATEFPPLRSLEARRGNLPTPLTSFVGRTQEVNELSASVGAHRLTTLVGPGGMGKTRLALEAARAAEERFPDGAWFVELAPVASSEAVDHALAAALGVEPRGDLTPRQQVVRSLHPRQALLVVDNCEHVLDAASDLLGDVLAHCPGMVGLATSREPLRVLGEYVWQIDPLDIDREAVTLFEERAAAARRGFALSGPLRPVVATICRRLDGMPLAIELAAARVRSMSPQEIADHLDERFRLLRAGGATPAQGRHATLEGVVAWSYDLLTGAEQRFLSRLAVFAGGFDLRAAHHVCSDAADEMATLDLLDALVERSLVVPDESGEGATRYRLLETIRQYAVARLDPGEGDDVRRRHARYFAEVVRSARPSRGGDQILQLEFDNLRSAVAFAIGQRDAALALGLVGPLARPASRQTSVLEAESWALAALEVPGARDQPDALGAHLLVALARNFQADDAGTEHHARAAIEVEQRLGLPRQLMAQMMLAEGAAWQGKIDVAMAAAREGAELAQRRGRTVDQVQTSGQLICFDTFFERPVDHGLINRCLALAEETGNPMLIFYASYVAAVSAAAEQPARAVQLFKRVRDVGERAQVRNFMVGMAYGFVPLLDPGNDPRRLLGGLLSMLDYFRTAGVAFGVRKALRDFLPTFVALERWETAAVIDGGAGLLSVRPLLVREAVAVARRAMGNAAYEQASARGKALKDHELEAFLLAELEELGIGLS